MSADFVRLAELLSDFRFKAIPLPYNRIINIPKDTDIDFIAAFKNPNLEKKFSILTPIGKTKIELYSNENTSLTEVISSNKNYRIGVLRGISYTSKESLSIPDHWDLMEINTPESALRSLRLKRLDGVLMSNLEYKYVTSRDSSLRNFSRRHIGHITLYAWTRAENLKKSEVIKLKKFLHRITLNGNIVLRWWGIKSMIKTLELMGKE